MPRTHAADLRAQLNNAIYDEFFKRTEFIRPRLNDHFHRVHKIQLVITKEIENQIKKWERLFHSPHVPLALKFNTKLILNDLQWRMSLAMTLTFGNSIENEITKKSPNNLVK